MKKFFAIAALVSALAMTASAAETEYVNRKYNHMIKVEAEAMARNLDSELGLKVYRDGVGTYSVQTDDGEVSVDVALMAAEDISI